MSGEQEGGLAGESTPLRPLTENRVPRGQGRRGTCAEEEQPHRHRYVSEVSLLERLGSAYRAMSIFMPFGPQNSSFLEIYLKETIQMPNAQTFHYDVKLFLEQPKKTQEPPKPSNVLRNQLQPHCEKFKLKTKTKVC